MTSGIVTSGPMPIIVMTLIETAPRRSIARFIGSRSSRCEARAFFVRRKATRDARTLRAFALLGMDGNAALDFVDSEALAGNPLGDPATRPSAVYLPPGYDPEGSTRYPALYVLHGYTGDVAALVSSRPWETNVVQWADRLIAAKRMPPVAPRSR